MTSPLDLAAMLDELATRIVSGRMGSVNEVRMFLTGPGGQALIITLPRESEAATALELRRAVAWLETGALPSAPTSVA